MSMNDLRPVASALPLKEELSQLMRGIVSRAPASSSSTHPSELVACQLKDGSVRWLHVKHQSEDATESFGHRGGLQRELAVYREVLDPYLDGTPQLLGWSDADGESTLVLEFLEDAVPIHQVEHGVDSAATWLAHFHCKVPVTRSLPVLDGPYYLRWLERTVHLQSAVGMSSVVSDALERLLHDPSPYVEPLTVGSPSVVHGEFFPHNVLWADGAVRPVDWESAALGAGEVDVASLIDDWAPDVAAQVESVYAALRWPNDLEERRASRRRVAAAAVYWSLRWLGDGRPWTEETRVAALGLLEARVRELYR